MSVSGGPVHRAFSLLRAVVAAGEPIGVRELARRTGISRSTVARQLGILEELSMVTRGSDGASMAGPGLCALVPSSLERLAPLDRLRPLLREMIAEFGEAAALGIDDGATFLYVAGQRSPSAVQVPDCVGKRYPPHVIAPGLVAMAFWSQERLEEYLSSSLETPTRFSVTDPDAIRSRLEGLRDTGHIWTDQELDLEVNGIAVPIIDDRHRLLAVASLYGPAYRLSPTSSPTVGRRLVAMVTERVEALV